MTRTERLVELLSSFLTAREGWIPEDAMFIAEHLSEHVVLRDELDAVPSELRAEVRRLTELFEIGQAQWNDARDEYQDEVRRLTEERDDLYDALDWAARAFVAQNHATGLVPSVLKVQAKVRAVLSESQETPQ